MSNKAFKDGGGLHISNENTDYNCHFKLINSMFQFNSGVKGSSINIIKNKCTK